MYVHACFSLSILVYYHNIIIVICIRPADDCCSGHLLRVAYRKSMVQNPWGAAQAAGRDELQVLVSWSSFEEFTESTNSCRWDERGISEPTRPDDEARWLNQLFQTDIERTCVEPGRLTALTDVSQLCWQVLLLLVGMLSMPQATLTFPMSGKHYSLDWTWILDWTGLWTGLLKICIFGAIALPKRPGGQCHAPQKPKHWIMYTYLGNCPSN